MRWFWLILAGVAGGVIGGMGFGGGTLLIPILTFGFGVPPALAAWTNLVVFIPMAAIALIFHAKNKLVSVRSALWSLLFALAGATVGLLLGGKLSEGAIRRCFGWALIGLGTASVIGVFLGFSKQK